MEMPLQLRQDSQSGNAEGGRKWLKLGKCCPPPIQTAERGQNQLFLLYSARRSETGSPVCLPAGGHPQVISSRYCAHSGVHCSPRAFLRETCTALRCLLQRWGSEDFAGLSQDMPLRGVSQMRGLCLGSYLPGKGLEGSCNIYEVVVIER